MSTETITLNSITIDSVYFAQTHVMEPHHPYFKLTGGIDFGITGPRGVNYNSAHTHFESFDNQPWHYPYELALKRPW